MRVDIVIKYNIFEVPIAHLPKSSRSPARRTPLVAFSWTWLWSTACRRLLVVVPILPVLVLWPQMSSRIFPIPSACRWVSGTLLRWFLTKYHPRIVASNYNKIFYIIILCPDLRDSKIHYRHARSYEFPSPFILKILFSSKLLCYIMWGDPFNVRHALLNQNNIFVK